MDASAANVLKVVVGGLLFYHPIEGPALTRHPIAAPPGRTTTAVKYGVYDPNGSLLREKAIAFEEIFVSWASYYKNLLIQLRAIQQRGHRALLTIEPWADPAITPRAADLLCDVKAGKYDNTIKGLSAEIAAFSAPVFLRWGHEMENVSGRYPWASRDSALFQDAYRHVVTTFRLGARNVNYVWSPVGDAGLEKYWPGSAYVDYVGLSVYTLPAADLSWCGKILSFSDIMDKKYGRVQGYRKPVIIAEMGVYGKPDYQQKWMSDALAVTSNYPLLKAIIYFNAKDTPGVWGAKFGTPDWRIDPKVFSMN